MKRFTKVLFNLFVVSYLAFTLISANAGYLEKCEHVKVDGRCVKCGAYYVALDQTVNVLDPESGSRYGFIQWGTTEGIEYIEDVIDVKPGVNEFEYKIYAKIKALKIG